MAAQHVVLTYATVEKFIGNSFTGSLIRVDALLPTADHNREIRRD